MCAARLGPRKRVHIPPDARSACRAVTQQQCSSKNRHSYILSTMCSCGPGGGSERKAKFDGLDCRTGMAQQRAWGPVVPASDQALDTPETPQTITLQLGGYKSPGVLCSGSPTGTSSSCHSSTRIKLF